MRTLIPLVTIILFGTMTNACHAQGLFGERDLGGSLSRRTQLGSASASGKEDGMQRFVRDARSVTDFVGSTAGEAGFVGRQSAVTTINSSVTGLTEEARPPINRPRIIRQGGLYAERLRLSPATQAQTSEGQKPLQLSQSLQSLIQSRSVTIEVSLDGHSATLRGAVPSEHERQTTELFVMFEPGIQKVENLLTVDPALPPVQRPPRVPKTN